MRRNSRIVDYRRCAWCTNTFGRNADQRRTDVRHCSRKCAGYGRAVSIPDAHWVRMAEKAHESRSARRLARLEGIVASLDKVQAYVRGYEAGYSAGKAKRRSLVLSARVAS